MYHFSKRAFDIFFSLLFLCIASPLILLIALAIKSTSQGPIIYRSIRIGKKGKLFSCLKFRTMIEEADTLLTEILAADREKQVEWSCYQKLKLDPRITPIGRFLRRTSLDEVPQFWNVLKGDLSVVGPRPLSPSDPAYGENANLILSVKPGITGMWQVSGRSHISLAEREKMETNYVLQRTLLTDLKVIVKTIPAVLFSKGAY